MPLWCKLQPVVSTKGKKPSEGAPEGASHRLFVVLVQGLQSLALVADMVQRHVSMLGVGVALEWLGASVSDCVM